MGLVKIMANNIPPFPKRQNAVTQREEELLGKIQHWAQSRTLTAERMHDIIFAASQDTDIQLELNNLIDEMRRLVKSGLLDVNWEREPETLTAEELLHGIHRLVLHYHDVPLEDLEDDEGFRERLLEAYKLLTPPE